MLVVVADGCDDGGDILRVCAKAVENAECHDGAALRVVNPVNDVADVMQVAGNLCQLRLAFGVAEREQDVTRRFRNASDMSEAVLREAHVDERFVRPLNIGADGWIRFDLFKRNHACFLCFVFEISLDDLVLQLWAPNTIGTA